MAGRNPNDAFNNYIEPLRDAVGCITRVRLTAPSRRRRVVNVPYTVTLGDNDPVPLKAPTPLALTIGQIVQIVETAPGDEARGPFKISTLEYLYAFSMPDDDELLAFHWTPDDAGDNVVTFPHMHIGPALLGGQAAVRPRNFHKAHVPSGGRVSLEAIIRLAIREFQAEPLIPNWEAMLATSEAAFRQWSTR